MTKREEFDSEFGDGSALLIEAAAESHLDMRDVDARGHGSDYFRWAILMVISFQCVEVASYREWHHIDFPFDKFNVWLMENEQRIWLSNHDGDVDMLAVFSGAYDQYMPDKVQEDKTIAEYEADLTEE